ncbi:beta strand repeat-containing protein [Pseudobdellovibrio sp. HCB154]|uniref:beta strand repeat-containing protein n=1 Tax=Pseudobdellovibrio sp. HCB154 TaxID=3386277 RepID=UPI003916F2B1
MGQSLLKIFLSACILLLSAFAKAVPYTTTYQAKIIKPDGYPLQASAVNFRFTIMDPTGSCVLYVENYAAINMSDSAGLVAFSLGAGVRSFPSSGTAATFSSIFDNATPSFSCQTPGVYIPTANDGRKIVMQFNDGSGWQTLPAMGINAVPYSMYAAKSENTLRLNGKTDSDFVEYSALAALNCQSNEAIKFNGASFGCIAIASATTVTSGSITTALGYTPADGATVASVSSTLFSVSSSVSGLQSSMAASFTALTNSVSAVTSSQWNNVASGITYTGGNVGINGTFEVNLSADEKLTGQKTSLNLGANTNEAIGTYNSMSRNTGSSSGSFSVGTYNSISDNSNFTNTNEIYGVYNYLGKNNNASANSKMYGTYNDIYNSGGSANNETYGSYNLVVGDADGNSVTYGNYVDAAGADTNYLYYGIGRADPGQTTYGFYVDVGTGTGTEYAGAFLNGHVGIGTATPVAPLDVSGAIRIGMQSTSCVVSYAGAIRYNAGTIEFCNGTTWGSMSTSSGMAQVSGTGNIAYGNSAGSALDGNSSNNILFGDSAGQSLSGGDGNIMIGSWAGHNNIGDENTFVGSYAGGAYASTSGTGYSNAIFGAYAGAYLTNGYQNTMIGYRSGQYTTTGFRNYFGGYESGQKNTEGYHNVFIGYSAGLQNTTANNSVGLGANALTWFEPAAYSDAYNTAIGADALYGVATQSTGIQNTALGGKAGNSITTGSNNILIGYDVDTPTPTTNNFINIGNTIFANSVTGNMGLGTSAPTSKLEISNGPAPLTNSFEAIKLTAVSDVYGPPNAAISATIGLGKTTYGSTYGEALEFKYTSSDPSNFPPQYIFKGTSATKDITINDGRIYANQLYMSDHIYVTRSNASSAAFYTYLPPSNTYANYDFMQILGAPGAMLSMGAVTAGNAVTGFYTGISSGTYDIKTSNISRISVTNAGNVGIGTSLPVAKLDVSDNAGRSVRLSPTGFAGDYSNLPLIHLENTNNSADDWFLVNNADRFFISTEAISGTEKFTVMAGGNVGIGTSSPASVLAIVGDGTTDDTKDDLSITTYSNATSPGAIFKRARGTLASPLAVGLNDSFGGPHFLAYDGAAFSSAASIYARAETSWTTTASTKNAFLSFSTVASGTPTEKMRISSNGYVGIGTTSPAYPLTVSGTIASTNGGFRFPDGSIQTTAAGASQWSASGTSLYYLSGNVGIGTSAPAAKLHVSDSGDFWFSRVEDLATANTIDTQRATINAKGNSYPQLYLRTIESSSTDASILSSANLSVATTASNRDISLGYNSAGIAGQISKPNHISRLFIQNSTGRVGVGTSAPTSILSLYNDGATDGADDFRITTYNPSDEPAIQTYLASGTSTSPLPIASGSNIGLLTFHGYMGSGFRGAAGLASLAENDWTTTTSTQNAALRFYTRGSGTYSEKMRITGSGNIAIGTTTPGNSRLTLERSTATSSTPIMAINDPGRGVTAVINSIAPNNTNGLYMGTTSGHYLMFGTSNFMRMMIDGTGNVGIGSTLTSTAKLTLEHPYANTNTLVATASNLAYWVVKNPASGSTNTWNSAQAVMYVGRDTGTSRSINAAGTINASGADFAEWVDWSGKKPEMGSVISYRGSYVVVSSEHTAAFIGNDVKDPNHAILVAFAGQLPVLVRGVAREGDLIVANDDGTARAVPKEQATVSDAYKAVGTAWASSNDPGLKRLHVAIGIGLAGGLRDIKKLEQENAELKARLDRIEKLLLSEKSK